MSESYQELQDKLKASGQTKQDVINETGGIDLDNLPRQEHNWVRRGIKMSCEGAPHPHHSHFLTGGRPMQPQ
jgi:hypothetical protein